MNITRDVFRNPLVRSVVGVATGRGSAQGIVFLTTLLSARHFSPEAFGSVGLFTSFAMLGAALSSFRFEARAQVSRREATRAYFFHLAYMANALTFVVGLVAITLAYLLIPFSLPVWLPALPLAILAISLTQYVIPAQNAEPKRAPVVGRVAQASAGTTAALQVAVAFLWPTVIGLVGARVAGPLFGLGFAWRSLVEGMSAKQRLSRNRIGRLVQTSLREFLLGAPANILSVIAFQVPVYIFTAYGLKAETGAYWLAFNLLFVPYIVVSASFRPIFLNFVSKVRPSEMHNLIARASLFAFAGGTVVVAMAVLASWFVTSFALGPDWATAGEFSPWLGAMLVMLVAVTPLTAATSALRLQGANLIYTAMQVACRAGLLAMCLARGGSALEGVALTSIASALISAAYLVWGLVELRGRLPKIAPMEVPTAA